MSHFSCIFHVINYLLFVVFASLSYLQYLNEEAWLNLNTTAVISVEGSSLEKTTLKHTREFILERNPLNVNRTNNSIHVWMSLSLLCLVIQEEQWSLSCPSPNSHYLQVFHPFCRSVRFGRVLCPNLTETPAKRVKHLQKMGVCKSLGRGS